MRLIYSRRVNLTVAGFAEEPFIVPTSGHERIVKHKVGLLNQAEELGKVFWACQVMGVARNTFCRHMDAV